MAGFRIALVYFSATHVTKTYTEVIQEELLKQGCEAQLINLARDSLLRICAKIVKVIANTLVFLPRSSNRRQDVSLGSCYPMRKGNPEQYLRLRRMR